MAQIHELYNAGKPASGTFFVTDNGEKTGKVSFENAGQAFMEDYTGTELAGLHQSPKQAIDTLQEAIDEQQEALDGKLDKSGGTVTGGLAASGDISGKNVNATNGMTVSGNAVATQTWVNNKGYATETWVNNKGYLTSSSLSGYATETWVNNKGYATTSSLSNYSKLLTTEEKTATISVNKSDTSSGSFSIAKSGYTPLGIVGWRFPDSVSSNLFLPRLYLSGTNCYWMARNTSASANYSGNLVVNVLYVKN